MQLNSKCLKPIPYTLHLYQIKWGRERLSMWWLRNRKHVPCFYWVIETRVEVWENEKQYFKNECECFIGVSNTKKLMKARGLRPSAFIVFECLKPRWNTKHEFLKLLLQQKKINLNYRLNRFLNSTIIFETWNMHKPQKNVYDVHGPIT